MVPSFLREFLVVALSFMVGMFPGLVYALPQDGEIISGAGSISIAAQAYLLQLSRSLSEKNEKIS